MIPPDIKQVVERLKARGLVGFRPPDASQHITSLRKTPRTKCRWCGKNISAVFGHHICKPRRMSLRHI